MKQSPPETRLLSDLQHIHEAALSTDDGQRCLVAPHPDLADRIKTELSQLRTAGSGLLQNRVRAGETQSLGLNDGVIHPPDTFPLGTPSRAMRTGAADRAPLRGPVRVVVVLVDFSDHAMTQTPAHFKDLFFSLGTLPTKSVREYYREVTNNLVDIQGEVVGPFRLPKTLAQYAHGASGMGGSLPNARTMAKDALLMANPAINFAPYDNDGDGYVDAFIVVHAGPGAEVTGSPNDIWSHKWVLDGGTQTVDGTHVYGYLTVPEDCRIGVCAHELGHLLFGFPDLYDTDYSSEGVGNWCLMAGGSWGGGGNTPAHPCAWCKVNQGWVTVDNRTTNGVVSIPDVKSSHNVLRLWKDGAPGSEYFLVENRQQTGFDTSLPSGGLLVWHVDESISANTNEAHYKVALVQADGQKALEHGANRGDAGDPFPGTSHNATFNNSSNPNSRSYANLPTCVAITAISPSAPVMTANVAVRCKSKEILKDRKDIRKETKEVRKELQKEVIKEGPAEKNHLLDKGVGKEAEKPVTDKSVGLDKGIDKPSDGKLADGKPPFGSRSLQTSPGTGGALTVRVAALEAAVLALSSGLSAEPFIGSELRPDLSEGALLGEEDYASLQQQMQAGAPEGKRGFDSKTSEA